MKIEKAEVIKNGNVNLTAINSGNVPVMTSLPLVIEVVQKYLGNYIFIQPNL